MHFKGLGVWIKLGYLIGPLPRLDPHNMLDASNRIEADYEGEVLLPPKNLKGQSQ
jgi:hypothetical protein